MKTSFNALKIRYDGPPVDPLITWLKGLGPGGAVLVEATRQALILGVLRNVRQRFLARMSRAHDVYLENDRETTRKARQQRVMEQRREQLKAKRRLASAYDRLERAALNNDAASIQSARKTVRRAEVNAMWTSVGVRGVGLKAGGLSAARAESLLGRELTSGNIRLGNLLNGLMKQRQLRVLRAFVDPGEIAVSRGSFSVTASSGSESKLDRIETPSVASMRGARTRSPYRKLWRHLEFGAGRDRIASSLNPVSPTQFSRAEGGWFFGPLSRTMYMQAGQYDRDQPGVSASAAALGRWGLRVRGVRPMQFLFADGQSPYLRDADSALEHFDRVVRESAPSY